MERLENEIATEEFASAQQTAKAVYSHLITDVYPEDYSWDNNESSKILALNLKFKRFVRFKRLLDSKKLQAPELLFIHHFLSELYLSLKEL